jgi:hypothetical protein
VSASVMGRGLRRTRTLSPAWASDLAMSLAIAWMMCTLGSGRAFAQDADLELTPSFVSPEHFVLELRAGPYQPNMEGNSAFDRYFSEDNGLLFAVELNVVALRLPDVLYLAGGGRIGSAGYDGKTLSETDETTSEETSLTLLPLDLMVVLRVDALARKLSVPFILTGKIGYEWNHWTTKTGGEDVHMGWSVGLAWAMQFAIDLDALDSTAARNLDEEWGINHSFLFFELTRFVPSDNSLPIGDNTWTAGLGFVF